MTVVIGLPGNELLARQLAEILDADIGVVHTRQFPDTETYLRYETPVVGRRVALVCTLDRPDNKFLPLIFAAAAARELGAKSVGLVAPYLAYMRQDRRFKPGEAITSIHFAKALEAWIDWLVTVDPHLHRRAALEEIYRVPSAVLHAAPNVAGWIRVSIEKPVLIGPDSESEQWVAAVAAEAHAPYVVLEKTRRGDRDVEVSVPNVENWRDRTPVLVDDIISTARTMVETVGHLKRAGLLPPVCIGVHGVFSENALVDLNTAGVAQVVTTNSIHNPTSQIDISPLVVEGLRSVEKM